MVILQNAYGVEQGYIPSYDKPSFRNCHTGRRLKHALPDNVNIHIINANPDVGITATSNFPPDPAYVMSKIKELKPDVILACGHNAKEAIRDIDMPFVTMPHPAYRALTNQTLYDTKEKLNALL